MNPRPRDEMRMDREQPGETLLRALGVIATDQQGRLSNHEWDIAILESVRQGVAPLLFRRVQVSSQSAAVPIEATRRLRQLAVMSAAKSLRLYRQLTEVLGVLRGVGIDVIVLKGAYLAQAIYKDLALRPMADVDLLVRKADLERTEAILAATGYAPFHGPHRDEDFLNCQHLHPLARAGGPPIEIHWTIESPTEPFAIDIEGLWERARPARVADVDVLVLSPEDLLLHLCLHTTFHHRLTLGLRGCWDLFEMIRQCQDPIDWKQLQSRAREWRIEKYVYLTLQLAKDLLGAAVPAEVLTDLRPNWFDPKVMALARTEILGQAPSVSAPFARMWSAGRRREKVRLLVEAMFPSRKALGRLYPTSRSALRLYPYYLRRWRELVERYGTIAWRVMRREEKARALIRREHERDVLMEWLKPASL
jgi:hypothetical protein